MAKMLETSITSCNGAELSPPSKTALEIVANAAPTPIIMAFPTPPAVPDRFTLTDNIPAVAFGMIRPQPEPTKVHNPKNIYGFGEKINPRMKDNDIPKIILRQPNFIINEVPFCFEYFPEI
tara:strand:- start:12 stop:374 length:363 start_codon:yes stop_codon:yes gene_type:complete